MYCVPVNIIKIDIGHLSFFLLIQLLYIQFIDYNLQSLLQDKIPQKEEQRTILRIHQNKSNALTKTQGKIDLSKILKKEQDEQHQNQLFFVCLRFIPTPRLIYCFTVIIFIQQRYQFIMRLILRSASFFSSLPKWATVDPHTLSAKNPHTMCNILDGKLVSSAKNSSIVDPLNGGNFINSPLPEKAELDAFVASQKKIPSFGLHNPIRNVNRYMQFGQIFLKIATQMRKPQVEDYFVKLIQRVMPKSKAQVVGEWVVTRRFFQNFTGDNPRFFQKSFNVAGDHDGQTSTGYRWPFGNVGVIAPFNFPLQIPALQVYGALLTGNRPLLKCDARVSVVMQQFLLFTQACGLPLHDVNFLNCSNQDMEYVIDNANFKVIQFTGSSRVAQHLAAKTRGKIRIEDAGFDWKILGPDVSNVDYVAWVSDQDAYAASGQKCSAQSIVFPHQNWVKAGFINKIEALAARRKLDDLTIGPVLTWSNSRIKSHIDKILAIPGAKLSFGGKPLTNHSIPEVYGAYEPTAIQVPLDQFIKNFELCSQQLFGPFQLIVPYSDKDIDTVIQCCNNFSHHLTAGVVSNDVLFLDRVLGQTINGVTYAGNRARTTGAPQNHWFGPCGDPRGAGIGSKEAILTVWTTHRQIIRDFGPVVSNWKTPNPS